MVRSLVQSYRYTPIEAYVQSHKSLFRPMKNSFSSITLDAAVMSCQGLCCHFCGTYAQDNYLTQGM